MQLTEMRYVDTVFGKFLRMVVNVPSRVLYVAPLRFIIGHLNLPRHLPGGTMPHENGTMDLADLEKPQAAAGGGAPDGEYTHEPLTENRKPWNGHRSSSPHTLPPCPRWAPRCGQYAPPRTPFQTQCDRRRSRDP